MRLRKHLDVDRFLFDGIGPSRGCTDVATDVPTDDRVRAAINMTGFYDRSRTAAVYLMVLVIVAFNYRMCLTTLRCGAEARMSGYRFNPPPGWTPPTGWVPDPSLPPATANWQWWLPEVAVPLVHNPPAPVPAQQTHAPAATAVAPPAGVTSETTRAGLFGRGRKRDENQHLRAEIARLMGMDPGAITAETASVKVALQRLQDEYQRLQAQLTDVRLRHPSRGPGSAELDCGPTPARVSRDTRSP
jgi:hypothetical protein